MKAGPGGARAALRETDLYPPLKHWLEERGYEVHGEVEGCDLAARRGEDLVLVEIKLAVNLELLLQVARRQRAAASVYAAVPVPKVMGRRWRELTDLLRRLEAGLILVFPDSPRRRVQLVFHPAPLERRPRPSAARAYLDEMAGRSRDRNLGGSTRRKIMTAYREQALAVAEALNARGPSAPKDLRAMGTSEKTGAILRDNHYGWFERLGHASYGLTEAGRRALDEYGEDEKESR